MARPYHFALPKAGRIVSRSCWAAPLLGATVFALALAGGAPSAQALTMKECSAKYHEAKTAGTLNGADWKAFRAAQCTSNASAIAPAGAAATPVAAAPAAPVTAPAAAPTKSASAKAATTPVAAVPGTEPVLPSAVSPKYATETAGKARMHTCLDQYNANKETGGNEGLKWIQKGGGYYSECTKHLKG